MKAPLFINLYLSNLKTILTLKHLRVKAIQLHAYVKHICTYVCYIHTNYPENLTSKHIKHIVIVIFYYDVYFKLNKYLFKLNIYLKTIIYINNNNNNILYLTQTKR